MLCYFKEGKSTTEIQSKSLCHVWRRCCDWSNVSEVAHEIPCLRFLMDDAPWLNRSVEAETNQIKTLTESHQQYPTWEIVNILKISKSSVENHLHLLDYVSHFDVWIPHKLSKKTFLTSFPYVILYWSVRKTSHF